MEKVGKEPSASCDEEKEKSPSPEPFKEPDGMVTIDLDRRSPSPLPKSTLDISKEEKPHDIKHIKYLSLLALLCVLSFAAAIAIHWEDIGWITKKFKNINENKTSYVIPTPAPFQKSPSTISIDMETCPIDPEEEYQIHLLMCERTKTFEDCCHNHLRSRMLQIDDVCSVLEMLDFLVEYKNMILRRKERSIDIEYKEEDFKKEKERKEQEKMRTKEKILSYIHHLNKPLQREIPALFDWLGDLFLEYQDEFEHGDKEDYSKKGHKEQHSSENHEENESNYGGSTILEKKPSKNLETIKVENSFNTNTTKEDISELGKKPFVSKIMNEDSLEETEDKNFKNQSEREKNRTTYRRQEFNTTERESMNEIEGEEFSSTSKVGLQSKDGNSMVTEDIKQQSSTSHIIDKITTINYENIGKGLVREKRDQMNENFGMDNSVYPQNEYYNNNGFEDIGIPNIELNPNNQQFNDMYPTENYGDIYPNNPDEEYPLVGVPQLMKKVDNRPHTGYHSLINEEKSDEQLRLPVYTEERDFGRHTWKDMNIFGMNQGFTLPDDAPRMNAQEFINNNGGVTYSYLETPRSTTEAGSTNTEFRMFYEESETTTFGQRLNNKKLDLPEETTTTRLISTSTVVSDVFDATDSIESIENIQGNNKSVLLEIGKTKIVISKADEKNVGTNEEMNRTEENINKGITETSTTSTERGKTIQRNYELNSGRAAQTKGFQLVNEDTQSSQNVLVNPNMCQFQGPSSRFVMAPDNRAQIITMVPPGSMPKPPFYVMNPSVYSYVPPNPVIPHYGPIAQPYNPYAFINPMSTAQMTPMIGPPVQMANNNGQVYLCNPALQTANIQPANNIQSAVEIRSSNNLQESFDRTPLERRTSNRTRASLNCPIDEQSCMDGSKCISISHVCDNEVHCDDGSDETFCSCRERIAKIRLCDGFLDCPDGEDELGCFGCSDDEINCDDWSRFRKGTCVPMVQRCDGVRQCEVTGKDEDDCTILTDHVGESNPMKISNAAGFLHRNYKGKWYPTCFGSEVWALDVCKVEAGPSTVAPLSHLFPTTEKYEGVYINLLPNKEVSFKETCVEDKAAFVECPPLFCGLRMTIKNPYRSQEVDTSIEDMMNHLNRQDYTFGDDLYSSRRKGNSFNRSKRSDDFILGGKRVVGGRASQPAAWPWVVSIYKNGIFHCGGVIINELWVLTAAHCVDKYWLFYYEIQAGILRRFSYSPMEQVRWVVATVSHEEYDKTNLKNDIALMRLSSAVRYNRYVRPICLPSETTAGTDFRRGPPPGTICTTVGWGATIEHGTDPDHMREVEVPILKNCKHPEDIEGREICAGLFEGGKDACQGDSGGPFMCQNPNNPSQWYLAGIVSHGEGCARPNEPGVYTRVSQYIDWIADNMREEKFFPRSPLQRCPGYICKGTNKCIPKKRHCDSVIDCLMGDDEVNCGNTFHNIFKFSTDSYIPFLRANNDIETVGNSSSGNDDILGAVIVNADFENSTVLPVKPPVTKKDENIIVPKVMYHYERKMYYNNNTNNPDYFRCERLLQMIPIRKRCDKKVDCEDGTDEEGCRCVDYIKLLHPDAICNGIVDCKDRSDESSCFSCRKEEFNCLKSRMCISLNLVCNGKPDCDKGEDEMDCVALTDGKTVVLDNTHRPNMSLAGIVSVKRNGIWKTYCNTTQSKPDAVIATNICNYLGFGEYTGFKKLKISDRQLSVEYSKSVDNQVDSSANTNTTCDGLYVWCSNLNHDGGLDWTKKKDLNDSNVSFEPTWNAAIFSDGIFKCMGAILNEIWILTSLNCFDGILYSNSYFLAVVVGKGARYLDVPGPNDYIQSVAESFQVNDTDMVVLRLENAITFNRYIQPTHLNIRIEKLRKEKCVAVGMKRGKPSLVFLEMKSKCTEGQICFSPASSGNCLEGPWSGVITCTAGNGWYPASVFSSNESCPFKDDANFTSVRYWAEELKNFTESLRPSHQESYCDGFRCDLGNCIDVDMLCDGIPQCLGGEDETPHFCEKRQNACRVLKNCVCPVDHLQCLNGNCVHKSKFCDRVNDCGDFSDEPPRCTCRSFLKLTHPEKVCDGHVNCFDGSDENPRMCQCKPDDFVCSKSNFCISSEMICNGFVDCPNGEDEKACYVLSSKTSDTPKSGAVLTRTAGQLFESCYTGSPSASELDDICHHLGFESCMSYRLESSSSEDNSTLVPVIDSFNVVWLRSEGKVPLLFRKRTGNDAYLTVRKQSNCHRLHIECN